SKLKWAQVQVKGGERVVEIVDRVLEDTVSSMDPFNTLCKTHQLIFKGDAVGNTSVEIVVEGYPSATRKIDFLVTAHLPPSQTLQPAPKGIELNFGYGVKLPPDTTG